MSKAGPRLLFLPVRLKNGSSGPGILAQGMNGTDVEGSLDLEPEGPGFCPGSFTY